VVGGLIARRIAVGDLRQSTGFLLLRTTSNNRNGNRSSEVTILLSSLSPSISLSNPDGRARAFKSAIRARDPPPGRRASDNPD